MPALEVLQRFRDRSSDAAMVVDEYGGIQGMISLNDLMEAITGDLAVSQGGAGRSYAGMTARGCSMARCRYTKCGTCSRSTTHYQVRRTATMRRWVDS